MTQMSRSTPRPTSPKAQKPAEPEQADLIRERERRERLPGRLARKFYGWSGSTARDWTRS